MFRDLKFREYEIAGNVLRAWYDEDGLAFVVDETIDEYKPNVLLVVRPQGSRRWDDLLQNVYNIDLEIVRPRVDNKYQKLDIEYGGIDVYENLINAYESNGDISAALEDLIDFRDAAVRRAATVRLTTAQDEIAQANVTAVKAENAIKSLHDRVRNLRDRLARHKSYVGREPTKQSASRILRTEAQIESADEKIARAERRLENARRRIDLATAEVNAALALLALRRPSVDTMAKQTVIDARVKKPDVVKMPVDDEESAQEADIKEPQGLEMSKKSDEEVKPLLDKDPEILDEEIAFKPVDFGDIKPARSSRPLSPYDIIETDEPRNGVEIDDVNPDDDKKSDEEYDDEADIAELERQGKSARSQSPYDVVEADEPHEDVEIDDIKFDDYKPDDDEKNDDDTPDKGVDGAVTVRQPEPVRPLSPFAASSDEPRPTIVRDDGGKGEKPFGFPGSSDDSGDDESESDNVDDYKSYDKKDDDYESDEFIEESVSKPSEDVEVKFEDTYSSKPVSDYSENLSQEEKSEFKDNYDHLDFEPRPYEEPKQEPEELKQEPVIDTIKSVDESKSADVDTTGQVSTNQYDNIETTASNRPFSPVEVPKMPTEEQRPMSPRYTNENPRPVGQKRSGFAYYILLILLIALSIFTLWLYQKKNGGTVPIIGPEPPVVEPVQPVPEPVPEPTPEPVPEPQPIEPDVPVYVPTPVDKPIDVRYPNDDILRGPEPEVRVIESEEDVLARKQAYGVSRDDIPVVVPVPEPVIETVIEEPVVQVTTVTAPDVIFEDDIVSVPMPIVDEDMDSVAPYDNPANAEYVSGSYVVNQPEYYAPEPQQYVPEPQYVQENNNYVEEQVEPVDETRRDFTVHDGGQYSVTKTVTFIPD